MKKILFFVMSCLFLASCAQDSYKINGEISGESDFIKKGEVYLRSTMRGSAFADTAAIVNGKFQFKGKCAAPFMYNIYIKGIKSPISFFLENGTIQISASEGALDEALVKGGETQKLINDLSAKDRQLAASYKVDELYAKYASPATTDGERENIRKTFEQYTQEIKSYKEMLLSQHKGSYFALIHLYSEHMMLSYEDLKASVAQFDQIPEMQNHPALQKLEGVVDHLAKLQIGQVAPDFTQMSDKGEKITLSDVYAKNKITMIDFWASWCGPCRKFNPVLRDLYKTYHKKGLEVLAVSLDGDEQSWKKAIKADRLSWLHVSDLNRWQNEVAVLYNVAFIPQNVFVDSEGKILARQLQEEEIQKFLEEHLK